MYDDKSWFVDEKSITDLWFCEINKNITEITEMLYEFKPKYNGYVILLFLVKILKTFRKLFFSIK